MASRLVGAKSTSAPTLEYGLGSSAKWRPFCLSLNVLTLYKLAWDISGDFGQCSGSWRDQDIYRHGIGHIRIFKKYAYDFEIWYNWLILFISISFRISSLVPRLANNYSSAGEAAIKNIDCIIPPAPKQNEIKKTCVYFREYILIWLLPSPRVNFICLCRISVAKCYAIPLYMYISLETN